MMDRLIIKEQILMKKDEQSLLRMNFLIQSARLYHHSFPQFSTHLVYDFVQMSQKKIIRIDKALKKKIDKKRFRLKNVKHMLQYLQQEKAGEVEIMDEEVENIEQDNKQCQQ